MEEQTKSDLEQNDGQWHHVTTIEDLGGLKRKVGITYDVEGARMAFDKAIQAVGKRVLINGFRRGKAPKALVEKFCAKEIEAAASTMLAQEGYLHAVYEHKLAALSEPKVENPKFNMDGTFSCEITVEVRPPISPSGYVGLRLSKPVVDPERIVSDIMGSMRERFARLDERETVGPGMTVVVDYSLSVDGKEVQAYQGVPFVVGEKGQLPFGSVQVSGLGVGASTSSRLTLPNDFRDFGGKEADVHIEIRRILESVPPTDEELATRNGLGSVDQLVANVRRQAEIEAGKRVRQSLEEQAVDLLLGAHEFEVPAEWVEHESQYLVKQLGISGEMDRETGDAVRSMSERNVRRSFMLDSIYDAEPILHVKSEELEALLDQEAARQAVPKTQLRRMLLRQGMMDSIVEVVKGRKIMDFLISNAEISTQGTDPVPQTEQGA